MWISSETLYLFTEIQLLLSVCLVGVLWALYTRMQKFEFFRWWAWAWTAGAAFLAAATVSMSVGTVWTPTKAFVVAVVLLAGFAQPLLLVLGGLSWGEPAKPLRKTFMRSIAIVSLVAAVCFGASIANRDSPLTGIAIRNVPRTLALAAALIFCCTVFSSQFRKSRSYAAAITGFFCLSYAIDQTLYFLSFCEILAAHWNLPIPGVLHWLAHVEILAQTKMLFLDLVDTCGICVGMILLLVERYQYTASELELSERQRHGLAVDKVSLQTEIVDRERVEQELRRSEEFSRQVVLNSPVAMVVARGEREVIELVNDKFTSLFGYTLDDVREVADWWPRAYPDPEYRRIVQSDWQRLLQQTHGGSAEKLALEARVQCKGGSFRDIEFHVSIVNDLYLISFVDLTERKRAMEDLRESESRYRDLVEHSEDLLGTHELDGKILSINNAPCRRLGYTVEEVMQMRIQDLIAPRFRKLFPHFVQQVLQNGQEKGHMVVVTRAGEERVWEYTSTLRREGVPAPVIRGMAHDVTEQFRAEQALKEHAMYMDALISNVPLGIVIKDKNQFIRFCNPAFESIFLYTQAELQGQNLDDLIAPHDTQEAARLSEAVQMGGVVHTTARRRRKDGNFIDVEIHGVKVFSGETFVGAFAIYQDITERKKSEEKLVALRHRLARAQEEERARIARDLHDDTGQRLALLSIDLEQLKQASMKLKSSLTQQLESLVTAASEITSDVHNVSRRLHPSQVELLGLGPALSNFCKEFGARNSMEIEFNYRGMQKKQPQDAALCLFRVAQEAIRNVQKHSGSRRAHVELDEIAGSLRLRVSDQGSGFDPGCAETSQGLGLLSMQERLNSLGGELFIHTRPGKGTCIEACIPLSPGVHA